MYNDFSKGSSIYFNDKMLSIEKSNVEIFKEQLQTVGHYFYRTLAINAYEYSEFLYNSFKRYCELGLPWYDYIDCIEYIKEYKDYKLDCDQYVSYRPNPLGDLLVIYESETDKNKKIILQVHPIEAINISLPTIKGYVYKEVYACLSYVFMNDKRMLTLKNMHTEKPLTSLTEFYNYESMFESDKIKQMWEMEEMEWKPNSINLENSCFMASKKFTTKLGVEKMVPIFYWNIVRDDIKDKSVFTITFDDIDWTNVKIALCSDTITDSSVCFEKTLGGFEHKPYKRALSHEFEKVYIKNKVGTTYTKTIPDYYDPAKDLRKNDKGLKNFYNHENYNASLGDSGKNTSGINLREKKSEFMTYHENNEEILSEVENDQPKPAKKSVKLNWSEEKNDKRTYNNIKNVLTSKKEDRL